MTESLLYSIITTCKGRLSHLKESLPSMLAQQNAEVIVVDFTCPEKTAEWVSTAFPQARLVHVEGKEYWLFGESSGSFRRKKVASEGAKVTPRSFTSASIFTAWACGYVDNATGLAQAAMPCDALPTYPQAGQQQKARDSIEDRSNVRS